MCSKNVVRFWQRWVGSSAYATVTTVLAVVAGLLGSVYGEEIGRSFPLHFGPYVGISYRALGFWLTLLLFAALFFQRQRHDDDARGRLEKSAQNIESLVETLPPRAFRAKFAGLSESVSAGISTVMPRQLATGVTAADLSKFIRSLLQAIANLALVFDDQPANAIYSANVMIPVMPSASAEAFSPDILAVLKFVAPETDLHRLKAVLLLRSDLSSTTASSEAAQDDSVPVIALPVPVETKRGSRFAVTPGAPNAFAGEQEMDGYSDSRTLAQWCAERGDFSPSVQDELREYFESGDGKSIRSFVSRRLTVDGVAIGVLNLHANRTNILGPASERREIFLSMLTPLLVELARAVALLTALERRG